MKYFTKFAFLFSLTAFLYIGCSESTTSNPPPTPPADSVAYKTSTNYKYSEYARDSTDKNTGVADTITATVKATGQTLDDQTGDVTIIENVHSTSSKDTTYIAQKSKQFWHYNFGLEGLTSVLKGSLGWVLQAKFDAKAGDKWVALPATSVPLSIINGLSADVTINATEQNDTTLLVGTESVSVKHVIHTVTVQSVGHTIVSNIDTYVSPKYGVVATVRHSTRIDVQPYYSGPVPGSDMRMTSHPN